MGQQQPAQLEAESNMVIKQRKHKSRISAPENHSLLCGSAKKEQPELQLFSEDELLKPSGHLQDDLAAVPTLAKWPA